MPPQRPFGTLPRDMTHATRWFTAAAVAILALTVIAQVKGQKVPKPDFKQYKRIHQKALDLIRTGKAQTAVKFLAVVEEKLPRDVETQYMLAVAQCTLGKADAAEASVTKALEVGLPVGRIIGGSHLSLIHI